MCKWIYNVNILLKVHTKETKQVNGLRLIKITKHSLQQYLLHQLKGSPTLVSFILSKFLYTNLSFVGIVLFENKLTNVIVRHNRINQPFLAYW